VFSLQRGIVQGYCTVLLVEYIFETSPGVMPGYSLGII